jgi:hypothetical protein
VDECELLEILWELLVMTGLTAVNPRKRTFLFSFANKASSSKLHLHSYWMPPKTAKVMSSATTRTGADKLAELSLRADMFDLRAF